MFLDAARSTVFGVVVVVFPNMAMAAPVFLCSLELAFHSLFIYPLVLVGVELHWEPALKLAACPPVSLYAPGHMVL